MKNWLTIHIHFKITVVRENLSNLVLTLFTHHWTVQNYNEPNRSLNLRLENFIMTYSNIVLKFNDKIWYHGLCFNHSRTKSKILHAIENIQFLNLVHLALTLPFHLDYKPIKENTNLNKIYVYIYIHQRFIWNKYWYIHAGLDF